MPDSLTFQTIEHHTPRHLQKAHARSHLRPSSLIRHWRIADSAYIVSMSGPLSERLCFIQGSGGCWVVRRSGIETMGSRKMRHLADRLNREMGVSDAAARALYIDWSLDLKAASIAYRTDPADYPQFKRDRRAKQKAHEGEQVTRAASGGYLRIATATNDLRNHRCLIRPGSIRYSWLMAHYEYDWANLNGRVEWVPIGPGVRVPSSDMSRLLPTELAAHRLCEAARAWSDLKEGLRRFSKGEERFRRRIRDYGEADRIRARRNTPEHRQAVEEAWSKSRPALRALLTEIGVYQQARAELEGEWRA